MKFKKGQKVEYIYNQYGTTKDGVIDGIRSDPVYNELQYLINNKWHDHSKIIKLSEEVEECSDS